jgi:hypothetical protein
VSKRSLLMYLQASMRADLDDFEWDFVQGTTLHTEGTGYPM